MLLTSTCQRYSSTYWLILMLKHYEILSTLGKGSFGRVYKARRRSDGFICVLKEVSLDGLSEEEAIQALNEVRYLSFV